MRTIVLIGVVLLCPLAFLNAQQPFDIKPGLWELTTSTQMSGLPPIPNLDQMTPEQRARIEAAMKNMGGAHSSTHKSCITRESIDKAIAQANSSKNNVCAPKLTNMTASKVEMHIDCTQEKTDMKSTGDVIIERLDPEHFKGNGTIKSAGANGRNMDVKWSMTGAFLTSDCGNIKPDGQ